MSAEVSSDLDTFPLANSVSEETPKRNDYNDHNADNNNNSRSSRKWWFYLIMGVVIIILFIGIGLYTCCNPIKAGIILMAVGIVIGIGLIIMALRMRNSESDTTEPIYQSMKSYS